MRKNKNTLSKFSKYLPVFIILLSISIIIGSTFAYFTDKTNKESLITFSKVELSSETTTGINGELKDVIPGTPITNGRLSFSKSIDSEPIYVRAKISFSLPNKYADDADMKAILSAFRNSADFNIKTGEQHDAIWSAKEGNYFYLLDFNNQNNLKIVDTIDTYVLSEEIVVPRDLRQLEENAQYMKGVNFHIAFEAIQAENVTSDTAELKELFNLTFPENEAEKFETIIEDNAVGQGMVFDGNKVVKYVGTYQDVVIPASYSIGEGTRTYEEVCETQLDLEILHVSIMVKNELGTDFYPMTVTDANGTYIANDFSEFETIKNSLTLPCSAKWETLNYIEGDDYEVTEIADGAFLGWYEYHQLLFYGNTDKVMQNVELPNTITKIGKYAFMYQVGLRNINLPSSLVEIDEGAFAICLNLFPSIVLPANLTTMPKAFESSGVKEILNKSKISSDQLNEDVRIIENESESYVYKYTDTYGDWIFYNDGTDVSLLCENVGAIDVKTPDMGVTLIGYYDESKTFTLGEYNLDNAYFTTNATEIELAEGVVNFGEGSLMISCNLRSFTVSSTVKSMSPINSFGKLESIVVHEDNTAYNDGNGSNCIIETATNTMILATASTVIPEGVTKISSAYDNNYVVKSVFIPDNVLEVNSFYMCMNLELIVFEGATQIPASEFIADCNNLRYVLFADETIANGASIGEACALVLQGVGDEALTYTQEVIGNITIEAAEDGDGNTWIRIGSEGSYKYYKELATA